MSRKMKDSGVEWIGEMPKDWEVIRTKNVYSSYKEIVGNRVEDFERLSLTLNGVLRRSKEDAKGLQPEKFEGYQILKENQLVFKLIDLENVSTSRVGLSPFTGIVSPAYIILDNTIASNFGYYYFLSMWHREIFNKLGGDGVRSNLNAADLLNIPYILLGCDEQQKIANFLDQKVSEIDHILEKTRQSIEEYKKYKQSIITEAVTKGLNPNVEMKVSGIEWIGDIPKHWEVKRMKQISQLNPNCKTNELYNDTIVTFTPMECVYSGYFENREGLYGNLNSSYTPFQNQDIIIAKVTPCFENGNIAIADNLYNEFGYGSSELFVIRCTDVLNKFLFYYLQNKKFIEEALSTMTGVAGLKRVSSYFMKNAHVTIPNIEEQHKIVNYLDSKILEIDNLVSQKETLLKDLESYKKSIIYECVTGKREVM